MKTTEAGGPRGYDAGKKINGRKRHALVDTDGRGLVLEPHPASIQDRDGGGALLRASRGLFPFIPNLVRHGGFRPKPANDQLRADIVMPRGKPSTGTKVRGGGLSPPVTLGSLDTVMPQASPP